MQIETTREVSEVTQPQPRFVEATLDNCAIQQVQSLPVTSGPPQGDASRQSIASRGLAQMFGLDIRAAILAVLVDVMVFTGDAASLGALLPFSVCVAGALGFITYKIQRRWYGDDHDSALIKAMIIGVLTAIPVPLTPLIAIPTGMVGIVKAIRRK